MTSIILGIISIISFFIINYINYKISSLIATVDTMIGTDKIFIQLFEKISSTNKKDPITVIYEDPIDPNKIL